MNSGAWFERKRERRRKSLRREREREEFGRLKNIFYFFSFGLYHSISILV